MPRRPRYSAHPDGNQPQIVQELEDCGYYVVNLSRTGHVFDLAVWGFDWHIQDHVWRMIEVKTDDGKLTAAQQAFQEEHPGAVHTARNLEDVLRAFGRGQ
jgi:hypothetical protein